HQITYRYFEELHACGGDRPRASYETMRTMFIPNFSAVVTDAAGLFVLILAKVALMQFLAIIMTFWSLSIIMTAFLVPAMCSLIPMKVSSEKWAKDSCQVDWLAGLLMKITRFSIGPGTKYVTGALIVMLAVFCAWQTSHLKIGDSTPGSPILWPEHPYNQDQALIDRTFKASSENLVLFYEGEEESIYDPAVLNTFEAFARHMRNSLPDIYKSATYLGEMVKKVNLTFHDGDELWQELPRDQNLLMCFIGLIKSQFELNTLHRFVDRKLQRAQITLFFSDHTSKNLIRIRDAAFGFFNDHSLKTGQGEFKLAGGRIGLEIGLNEEMKRAHAVIDLTVFSAIFILVSLSFRSVIAGLMLTLPLILANTVAGAYMSLSDIGLSVNTLPVAAIGAGVGVDFAIYLYSRCQEEFANQSGDWMGTITQSICTCGKAVVFTGLTIILPIITWYFFSDMKFQAQVGFFLAMIMGTNVILTVTLHPLLLYIIKPDFISKKNSLSPKTQEIPMKLSA
ncbi:MAG: MMPL family transporter, partial [Desulfatitalea sp.]|nr:MMPL family transporter [Desulfatitalea sp.]